VPHHPGAPVLHAEGDPIILRTPGRERSPQPGSKVVSDGGDHLPFPSLMFDLAPSTTTRSTAQVQRGSGPTPGTGSSSPVVTPVGNRMPSEKGNETRPHDRPSWDTGSTSGAGRPSLEPVRAGPCANCRQPVSDSRRLQRCLACLRRLCADCVVTAHRTRGGVWCSRCTEAENRDSLSSELARRAHPGDSAGSRSKPSLVSAAAAG
jgi:hypothetical protein